MPNSTAGASPGRERFAEAYRDKAPWDLGRPQAAFVDAADQVTGSVIDLGCGTGENALFFASRGHDVLGIDVVPEAVARARAKAAARGITADFQVADLMAPPETLPRFDSAIDSGTFHVFADDDRARYVALLARLLRPGGRLFLLCFSDREPAGRGPRRVSQAELRAAFSAGWEIKTMRAVRFETAEGFESFFSPGGPHAWFAMIERSA